MRFLILLFVLVACSKETTDVTEVYSLPKELAHCKIYEMQSQIGTKLTIVSCPNSTTGVSYNKGKIKAHTIVINGETYIKVNE